MNMKRKNKTLFDLIVMRDGVIQLLPGFAIRDLTHALELLKSLEVLYSDLSIISEKGYINDPKVNLPLVYIIIKQFETEKLFKKYVLEKFNGSIVFNTILHNLILLINLRLIVLIEQ